MEILIGKLGGDVCGGGESWRGYRYSAVHGDGREEIDAQPGSWGPTGSVCGVVFRPRARAPSEVATAETRRSLGQARTRSPTNGWERVAWPAVIFTASSTLVYLHFFFLKKKSFKSYRNRKMLK
jgi:hypothetical protein